MNRVATIRLTIDGLGIIMYSPSSVQHIPEGSDYLSSDYSNADQVQRHIQAGSLVAFGTGSPGVFLLQLFMGYPSDSVLGASEFRLRLGLKVTDRQICFRDLYDLVSWSHGCPADQCVTFDDGIYHVTLCSDLPPSGVLGDQQEVQVYFQPLEAMPALSRKGIPILCQ